MTEDLELQHNNQHSNTTKHNGRYDSYSGNDNDNESSSSAASIVTICKWTEEEIDNKISEEWQAQEDRIKLAKERAEKAKMDRLKKNNDVGADSES